MISCTPCECVCDLNLTCVCVCRWENVSNDCLHENHRNNVYQWKKPVEMAGNRRFWQQLLKSCVFRYVQSADIRAIYRFFHHGNIVSHAHSRRNGSPFSFLYSGNKFRPREKDDQRILDLTRRDYRLGAEGEGEKKLTEIVCQTGSGLARIKEKKFDKIRKWHWKKWKLEKFDLACEGKELFFPLSPLLFVTRLEFSYWRGWT